MRRLTLIPIALLASAPAVHASQVPPSSAKQRPFRVVVDPGHGGTDLGTVFDNGAIRIAEKDVTLAIAKEVSRQLRAKGYRVSLTRYGDKELTLPSRTSLANRIGADVFLSIHMNSTSTPMVSDAEGIETYILNNASDASSRRLAHLENSVLGNDARIDAPTDVALILKDLRLDANLSESKRLACALQSHLVEGTRGPVTRRAPGFAHSRHRDRGVKQALFHVLLGADMPSVLVEAGFLTSPRDRELVLSPAGRRSIAKAITRAVEQFRGQKDTQRALVELSRCKVN
jgi:N-acetylmuramoyl-L-alanine amidase